MNLSDRAQFDSMFPALASGGETDMAGRLCRYKDSRPSDGEVHRHGVFRVLFMQLDRVEWL